jgi:hypothetical protein
LPGLHSFSLLFIKLLIAIFCSPNNIKNLLLYAPSSTIS